MQHGEVIDLCDIDDEAPNGGVAATAAAVTERQRRRSANAAGAIAAPPSDEDEIQMISFTKRGERMASDASSQFASGAPAGPVCARAASQVEGEGGDDEVQVVSEVTGERAIVDYGHMRFSCGEHPFASNGAQAAARTRAHCAKCYCYVCDVQAGTCTRKDEHWYATDKAQRPRQGARAGGRRRQEQIQNLRAFICIPYERWRLTTQ